MFGARCRYGWKERIDVVTRLDRRPLPSFVVFVVLGVVFRRLMAVMGRMQAVRVCDMGVVPSLLMVPGIVMLGGFAVMMGGVLMVLGRGLVMLATFVLLAHLVSSFSDVPAGKSAIEI